MMGRHGHLLSNSSPLQRSILKRLPISSIIRRCNYGGNSHEDEMKEKGIDQERAPSTADEFRRVAEEKKAVRGEAAAEDGGADQDTDLGAVKEEYKETQGKAGDHTNQTGNQPQATS